MAWYGLGTVMIRVVVMVMVMVMPMPPSANQLDLYDGSTLVRHGKSRNRTKRGLAKHTQPWSTWRALEGKKLYKHIHNFGRHRKPRRGPNKAVKQQANHNLTQSCSTKETSQGDERRPCTNSHKIVRQRELPQWTKRCLAEIHTAWVDIGSLGWERKEAL